jgi:O-antigen ligase
LTYFSRLSHPVLGPSNNLATVLAFFAPVLLYFGHVRASAKTTWAGVVAVIAIVLTFSRGILGAFVIAGVLCLPFLAVRRRTRPGLMLKVSLIVVAAGLGIALFYATNTQTQTLFKNRLSGANVQARAHLYFAALGDIARHPLLGLGGGVDTVTLEVGAPALPPPPLDQPIAVAVAASQQKPHLHDTYLEQMVYFGIPLGLLVGLGLVGISIAFFRAGRPPISLVVGYAVLVQLISYLFEASFEGVNLRILFYLSVGFGVALVRAAERERFSARAGLP